MSGDTETLICGFKVWWDNAFLLSIVVGNVEYGTPFGEKDAQCLLTYVGQDVFTLIPNVLSCKSMA